MRLDAFTLLRSLSLLIGGCLDAAVGRAEPELRIVLREFNSTAVELSWSADPGLAAYLVHVGSERVVKVMPPATRTLVTGLTPNAAVPLYVGTIDAADREIGRSDTITYTVPDVPFPRGQRARFAGHYGHTEVILPVDEAVANLEQLLNTTPALAGISIKVWWKTLHPQKNRVRWDFVERMLATCARHGKKAHLAIFPGMNSPDWIYGEGVRKVGPVTVGGQSGYTPLPWDPKYIERFTADIVELARRHADDPRLDSIQITGHNYKGGEMHAPKADTVGMLVQHGLTRSVAVTNWQYWIDLFGTNFRRQKLNLVISQMYPDRVQGAAFAELPEEIARYFVEKYQGRAILQTMQLNGRESADRGQLMSQEICRKYRDLAPNCHEMVGSFKTQPDRQGTPEMTIFNFVRQGDPLYLQYWRADALDAALIARMDAAWQVYGGMDKDALAARLKREGKWIEASAFVRSQKSK